MVIVSGDKDFYQLIGSGVSLLNPGRGGPAAIEEQWVDESNAAERLGVPADRVVDYLALVGDSSDNIPGVRGVGEKTARQLIEQYGDFDSIFARAQEVSHKRTREALLQGGESARISRDLVTIRRNLPLRLEPEALRVAPPDVPRLRSLFTELEFQSLLGKLDSVEPPAPARHRVLSAPTDVDPTLAQARASKFLALAVVTSEDDPLRGHLIGLSLATPAGSAYLPFGHRLPEAAVLGEEASPLNLPSPADPALRALKALLGDPAVRKGGHDVKRASLALRRAGVDLAGIAYDTMLASFVLDPGKRSHDLDVLVLEYLGRPLKTAVELAGQGRAARSLAEVPMEEVASLGCESAEGVRDLREYFAPRLEELGLAPLLDEIEIPLIGVLADMEWRGIAIDAGRLAELSRQFGTELQALEREIHHEAGTDFNINSTPQLRHILFEKLQLPVLKKTKTGPSTDADVLGQLAETGFAVPRLLLEYRELSKLKSTYVDVLPQSVDPATGRIHTRFNQAGAATGRLSSSDPNLQNIPVRTPRGEQIRRCFVAAQGCQFVIADYSQIELRLLAHFSEDPVFIGACERGGDIHRETAAIIFEIPVDRVTPDMRSRAKTINFATIYGQGPFALSRQLNVGQEEARNFIRRYFERFAGVRRFLDATIEKARQQGYVETLRGRRRYIPELKDSNHNVRAFGERTAMNSPLQGSAADLIKIAMIGVARALAQATLKSAMVLQVHDELIIEAPDDEIETAKAIIRERMEGAAQLRVPLVVDVGVGPNWLDAKR